MSSLRDVTRVSTRCAHKDKFITSCLIWYLQILHRQMDGLQYHFYDPAEQMASRSATVPRLNSSTVAGLVKVMKPRVYACFLRSLFGLEDLDCYHITIKSDSNLDQRVYNKPTSTEVAGIWIEEDNDATSDTYCRDIRVYARSGQSHNIQCYYSCYDPLQYVLMFPSGEPGWNENIPNAGSELADDPPLHVADAFNPNSSQLCEFDYVMDTEIAGHRRARKPYKQGNLEDNSHIKRINTRSTVSCRQYYAYKLQQRRGDNSFILRFERLLQQYVVDMYIKIETMRLAFFENNRDKMRVEHYKGIMDSVISGIQKGGEVGIRVYLPPTFIGGPREMRHRYLD